MKKTCCLLFFLVPVFLLNEMMAQTADPHATAETSNLLHHMKQLLTRGILFGHQDDLAYGVGWKYEPGRSDVKSVTGEYPAVYGWDLAGLEKKSSVNIDSVPFDKMRKYIGEGYARGGIITISWHLNNPLTGGNAWDTTHGGVSAALPGGTANTMYIDWLNQVADFLLSLKGKGGEPIPVLFRPFHELTGNWFWWTKNTCTAAEFIRLWKYTIDYLRDTRKVHNLLYVYNPADFKNRAEFLERYPGDSYADVISFDAYQYNDPAKDDGFAKDLSRRLDLLDSLAIEMKKLPALAETGYEAIPYADWWTRVLWPAIARHPLSYVLLWRNHGAQQNGHMHYYVPYPAQVSEKDFKAFYQLEKIFFENKTRQQNLYSRP